MDDPMSRGMIESAFHRTGAKWTEWQEAKNENVFKLKTKHKQHTAAANESGNRGGKWSQNWVESGAAKVDEHQSQRENQSSGTET
jgi:hypothetical protein